MIIKMATPYSNDEYGSVFKSGPRGGPRFNSIIKGSSGLPSWADRRREGNTNPNEPANSIMKKWDDKKMKRFEMFMDQFYKNMTPWRKEYMDKSAPNFKKQELDIIKCKMELIKRLLKIKMIGPESLEDWCLLFMYYDNELNLPDNIEQLVRPNSSEMDHTEYMATRLLTKPTQVDYYLQPPIATIVNPSNPSMPEFGTGGRRFLNSDRPSYGLPRIVNNRQTWTVDAQAGIGQRITQFTDIFPRGSRTVRRGNTNFNNLNANPVYN